MTVAAHLQKARAFLQDAQLCADHGRYDSSASRASYAMFRAAIALLEHGDVQELRDAYTLRFIADYRDRQLSSQETQTALEAAQRFVTKIEGVISRGTHP